MKVPSTKQVSSSSLDILAVKFKQWRTTRENRRTSVPKSLREEAINLLEHHPKSHVIKALGINSNMLKNWQGLPVSAQEQNTFVPLSIEPPQAASSLELTLTYSQGAELTLKGDLSLTQLTALFQGLRPSQEALR